jgi:hypothetical protein
MCGSDTIWECTCSDMDEFHSTSFNNWNALEEAVVEAWTNVSIKPSIEIEENESLKSDSDAWSENEVITPVRGRMVAPAHAFDSPDCVAAFPTPTISPTDIDFDHPPQPTRFQRHTPNQFVYPHLFPHHQIV